MNLAVAMPGELEALLVVGLTALFTFLVTQGLKALSNLLNKDFSGWASAIVAVFVGSSMFFLKSWLALIPPEYDEVVAGVYALLLAILSAFGYHYTRKNP